LKYSDPIGRDGIGQRNRWTWTKILKALRHLRKETDKWDTGRARAKYGDTDIFTTHFSYRKGSKLMPFKKDGHIARKLRKLEGQPRFWDYEEEEEEEFED